MPNEQQPGTQPEPNEQTPPTTPPPTPSITEGTPNDPLLAEPAALGQDGPVMPVVSASVAPKSRKWLWIALAVVAALVLAAGAYWLGAKKDATVQTSTTKKVATQDGKDTEESDQAEDLPTVEGLQLDTAKNYGDKYSDGLLPVGDSKYSTSKAQAGYIYTCDQYAQSFSMDKGGAGTRGPWFTNNNTQYDINKKAHIMGSVTWQGDFSNTVSGDTRTITTNDLPGDHTTGTFPVKSSDPAYAYDRNPNTIKAQTLSYALTASPVYSATPQCMGGEAGVMLTGVAIFNGFDAGGRDAGAWEVQDSCSGHPQNKGEYHYHTLSSCIKDISVKTILGYALDGFPITGPQVGSGNILTTSDLDECHGIVSTINIDGKLTTTYHYVMTQDFPYSVSCFRAKPADPPGEHH